MTPLPHGCPYILCMSTVPGVELSICITKIKPEYFFLNGWEDTDGKAQPIDLKVYNFMVAYCPNLFLTFFN